MVNVPGRSRGCLACRQRKLKCDESTPECLKCVSKGLRCSGPRTEAIFIHALPSQPGEVQSRQALSRNAVSQKTGKSAHYPAECRDAFSMLPSSHQPSRTEIFDQLFVSHFIESFAFKEPTSGKQPATWLDKLAELIVSPSPNAVRHSIRASSMFFYGSMTRDTAIQTEASRWYLRALQGLQYQLAHKDSNSFNGNIICAAVMLTHFESLAGTASDAWFQHVRGASLMIAMGGPESCRQGFLHDIFRHLRLLTAISSLFRNEQHPFCRMDWINVPFEVLPKGPFDELVDIYFSLLPCLASAEDMITSTDTGKNPDILKCQLGTQIHQIMMQLHNWWSQCVSRTDLNQPNPTANILAKKDEPSDIPGNPHHIPLLPRRDMPTAALSGLFDAANIIILRLFSLVSSSAHLYEPRIQQHVRSILSAMDFVTKMPPAVSQRGFIMVALPFRIAQIWAPCVETDISSSPQADTWAKSALSSAAKTEFFAHVAAYIHKQPS